MAYELNSWSDEDISSFLTAIAENRQTREANREVIAKAAAEGAFPYEALSNLQRETDERLLEAVTRHTTEGQAMPIEQHPGHATSFRRDHLYILRAIAVDYDGYAWTGDDGKQLGDAAELVSLLHELAIMGTYAYANLPVHYYPIELDENGYIFVRKYTTTEKLAMIPGGLLGVSPDTRCSLEANEETDLWRIDVTDAYRMLVESGETRILRSDDADDSEDVARAAAVIRRYAELISTGEIRKARMNSDVGALCGYIDSLAELA